MTDATQNDTAHTCSERNWCTMTSPAEHAEYHGGHAVRLAHYDAATDTGWSAHLAEDRGNRPRIYFEGNFPGIPVNHHFDVDAMRVLSILWATSTPEARAALEGMLDQIAAS